MLTSDRNAATSSLRLIAGLSVVAFLVVLAGFAVVPRLSPDAEQVQTVEPTVQGPSQTNPRQGLDPATQTTTSTANDGSAAPGETSTTNSASTTTVSATVARSGAAATEVRAAFFYPWFPDAWDQRGFDPYTTFTPELGRYDSWDHDTIRTQLELAGRAHLDAFIASWWGPGHHTDDVMPALLDATISNGSDVGWAVYYEEEGQGDPSPAEIVADLRYLERKYFGHPSFLRVDGAPVVFVWADPNDGEEMADRWASARRLYDGELHVVLKVFSGYRDVVAQPQSWHQYGPAAAFSDHSPNSVTISPGFWLKGQEPRLERDANRFEAGVRAMNESGAFWKLITSWNEWGEGTSIEPALEFGDAYIDILARNPPRNPGDPTATTQRPVVSSTTTSAMAAPASTSSNPTTTTAPANDKSGFTFTAGGDIGASDSTNATLAGIAEVSPRFHLALGDFSYSDLPSESEWCEYVRSYIGSIPMQLIVGNHEDDDRLDGHIDAFASCLPDRLGSVGAYGSEYYFDVDGLMRVIMIGADNTVGGVDLDYEPGTVRYAWLQDTIQDARTDGIPWVVVGTHKVCISSGNKSCEIGEPLLDLLIDSGVDLILHGHDHTYQRSKQLRCAQPGTYVAGCVVDDDDRLAKGAGTVWVINGLMGGTGITPIDESDPEFPYLAAAMGAHSDERGRGFLKVDVTSTQLNVRFVGSTTTYTDEFRIG